MSAREMQSAAWVSDSPRSAVIASAAPTSCLASSRLPRRAATLASTLSVVASRARMPLRLASASASRLARSTWSSGVEPQ